MGAMDFYQKAEGKTAREAFDAARKQALFDHGHAGYTGTIAEKHSFKVVNVPAGVDPRSHAEALMEDDEHRHGFWHDKWGDAGCVQTGPEEFLFFGWASC